MFGRVAKEAIETILQLKRDFSGTSRILAKPFPMNQILGAIDELLGS